MSTYLTTQNLPNLDPFIDEEDYALYLDALVNGPVPSDPGFDEIPVERCYNCGLLYAVDLMSEGLCPCCDYDLNEEWRNEMLEEERALRASLATETAAARDAYFDEYYDDGWARGLYRDAMAC